MTAIGPKCDIYSLGVIFYELLTARRPFEGPSDGGHGTDPLQRSAAPVGCIGPTSIPGSRPSA